MKRITGNLALAVVAFSLVALAAMFTLKLFHPRFSRTELADLSPQDRQRLAEEILEVSGTGYVTALHEPAIGYTLVPDTELTLWDDTFRSSELGYRAPRAAKRDGTFRIVVVGDSWTYGMGVSAEETFPAQLTELANRMLPAGPEIEAWPLALPGYNTLNEVAALEVYFDRLQPDAVVICPTRNDADSSFVVSLRGTPKRPSGDYRDRFGSDHWLSYRSLYIDSFLWRQRWSQAFSALRETEAWLAQRQIPLLLFFVAAWEPAIVHDLVGEAGIEAPYLILPREMTRPEWLGSPPWGHGTPDAYRVFARLLYRGLAETLGWPPLPVVPADDPHSAELYSRVPAENWSARAREVARRYSLVIPTRFQPGGDPNACGGPMDCLTGLMGRRTTVLVRRREGATRLAIELGRLEEPTTLYPLRIEASIPTAGGGTRAVTTIPADGPRRHRFTVDLPDDVGPGEVVEVQLRAERATLAPDQLALRTVFVLLMEQEG